MSTLGAGGTENSSRDILPRRYVCQGRVLLFHSRVQGIVLLQVDFLRISHMLASLERHN